MSATMIRSAFPLFHPRNPARHRLYVGLLGAELEPAARPGRLHVPMAEPARTWTTRSSGRSGRWREGAPWRTWRRCGRRPAQVRYFLLGEQHDNPDHHRLQAALVRAIAETRSPARARLRDARREPAAPGGRGPRPRAQGRRRARPGRGLGAQRLAGLVALPPRLRRGPGTRAAHHRRQPPARAGEGARHEGPQAMDAATAAATRAGHAAARGRRPSHARRNGESHCGHLPEEMMEPMVLAQRARDAHLAVRMRTRTRGRRRHPHRRSRARASRPRRPLHLAREAPRARVRSVALRRGVTGRARTPGLRGLVRRGAAAVRLRLVHPGGAARGPLRRVPEEAVSHAEVTTPEGTAGTGP